MYKLSFVIGVAAISSFAVPAMRGNSHMVPLSSGKNRVMSISVTGAVAGELHRIESDKIRCQSELNCDFTVNSQGAITSQIAAPASPTGSESGGALITSEIETGLSTTRRIYTVYLTAQTARAMYEFLAPNRLGGSTRGSVDGVLCSSQGSTDRCWLHLTTEN